VWSPFIPFSGQKNVPSLLHGANEKGPARELLEDSQPALAARYVSRGWAFGDFDNSGELDILIMDQNEAVIIAQRCATGKPPDRNPAALDKEQSEWTRSTSKSGDRW
jgi:hypothetical protein